MQRGVLGLVCLALLLTITFPSHSSDGLITFAHRAATEVKLEVLYYKHGVSRPKAADTYPNHLAILTANFFHQPVENGPLAVIGLLVAGGGEISSASGRANRGVLLQRFNQTLAIMTERKATRELPEIETAVEAAPLMVADGEIRDYSKDVTNRPDEFYRRTYRVLVGLGWDGRLFWVTGKGTLGEVHQAVAARAHAEGFAIEWLLALDGGTTAEPAESRPPPARLIIQQAEKRRVVWQGP